MLAIDGKYLFPLHQNGTYVSTDAEVLVIRTFDDDMGQGLHCFGPRAPLEHRLLQVGLVRFLFRQRAEVPVEGRRDESREGLSRPEPHLRRGIELKEEPQGKLALLFQLDLASLFFLFCFVQTYLHISTGAFGRFNATLSVA